MGFSAMSMEKGCKMNHRNTLYSPKGNIMYVVGQPRNIYRLQGKPYDNYVYTKAFFFTQ